MRRSVPRRFVLLSALAALGGCAGPSTDTIIVSGASGQLGGLVVEELLARGVSPERLVLVSRTPEELARYAEMGASTRFGDFTRPESLAAAYAGGERMLLISIDTGVGAERAELHKNAIDAAVRAGVRHIVYTSFVDVERNDSPLARDHRLTEQYIRDSGVTWTMLRNSLYANGLVARAARMLAEGRVVRSDRGGVAYVTREDCAAAAAAVLMGEGHENRAYDITGPEVVYPQDIARAASEVTGRPVAVLEPEPPAPSRAGAATALPQGVEPGASPPGEASFRIVSTAVQDLTGRPATSLRDFFEAHREELLAGVR